MGKEWKSYVLNSGFLIGVVMMLISLLCCSIPLWMQALTEPVPELRPNALVLSLQAVFFGGVILLFPFSVCLPAAAARQNIGVLHDDQKGWARYGLQKIGACALAGGAVAALPFALHAIVWNLIAIPASPELYETHQIHFYGVYEDWYRVFHALPMYVSFTLGMMICGGVFAVMYLAFSVWILDRVVSLILPAAIYFLWLKLGLLIPDPAFPKPADLFNDALTKQGIAYSLIVYALLLMFSACAYLVGLKREVQIHA